MTGPGAAGALRVLLVDDEPPARARLRRLLAQLGGADDAGDTGGVELVGEASSGDEAVRLIRARAPDLVLLDIQMPGCDGFGVIEAVGADAMPLVAFTTAYDEHAIRAFEVHAIDYLLKPIRGERLASLLARARRLTRPAAPAAGDQFSEKLAGLLTTLGRGGSGGWMQRIMVHHAGRSFLLPVSRIVRISSDRNIARLHVAGGQYHLRTPIGALESRLDPDAFLRINRSDIVRLDAVKEMHPWSHGDYHVVLTDGTTLVWSRRYRRRTGDRFGP